MNKTKEKKEEKYPFYLVPITLDRYPISHFARHKLSEIIGLKNHNGIPNIKNSISKYFSGFELNIPYYGLFDEENNILEKKLRQVKKKIKPIKVVHGCFERQHPMYEKTNLNLAKKLTEKEQRLLENNLIIADRLIKPEQENRFIVLHAGYKTGNQTTTDAIKQVAENIASVEQIAKNKGITILLENLPLDNEQYITTNPKEIGQMERLLNQIENTGWVFDYSHADVSGTYQTFLRTGKQIFLNKELEYQNEIINILGERIMHTHLNYGDNSFKNGEYANNQEKNHYELFDQHKNFTQIPKEEFEKVMNVFKRLFTETGIKKTMSATMEMMPKNVFKWIIPTTINQYGFDSVQEIRKSAKILEKHLKCE